MSLIVTYGSSSRKLTNILNGVSVEMNFAELFCALTWNSLLPFILNDHQNTYYSSHLKQARKALKKQKKQKVTPSNVFQLSYVVLSYVDASPVVSLNKSILKSPNNTILLKRYYSEFVEEYKEIETATKQLEEFKSLWNELEQNLQAIAVFKKQHPNISAENIYDFVNSGKMSKKEADEIKNALEFTSINMEMIPTIKEANKGLVNSLNETCRNALSKIKRKAIAGIIAHEMSQFLHSFDDEQSF